MKKSWWGALALLPLGALASEPFAKQWPLQPERPDAGAYRVELAEPVYRAAYWRDLRDIRVIDADGTPVPAVVQAAPERVAAPARVVDLRWFPLPVAAASGGGDLSVVVQRDGGGRVVSIRDGAGTRTGGDDPAWLVDLGDEAAQLRALRVEWQDGAVSLDLGFRLEGSDDLRHWRVLDPNVRLVQLSNQGHELRNDRIAVNAAPRYLRLQPLQRTGTPALNALRGEMAAPADDGGWQWLRLEGTASDEADGGFLYCLHGRFPVRRVDVEMPANSAVAWTLSTRDDVAGAETAKWRVRANGWNTWRVDEGGSWQHSPPLDLGETVSDCHWRLKPEPGTAPATAPVLRLGYRPGSVVFLAQGRAPYTLLAGSAAVEASPQPGLDSLLDTLRARNGEQWQPAAASLGEGSERAGDAAYQSPAPKRDWKNLVLWAVLVLGALAVASFALSLLRGSRRTDTTG